MHLSDLPAILGGEPIFKEAFHLVKPNLPLFSKVVTGIEELYESRILTNQGIFVRTLEERIAKELGVKHCALLCNGTTAIMCMVKALGLEEEILVPSFTFAATTQALLWMGLKPRFVDINPSSLTMDPQKIEKAISKNTSAIFPVNVFGNCCEHEEIKSIARRYDLPLIYDSAEAFGSKYKGNSVGSLGDAEVLSFHATKIFHTGEGGAVVTNNTRLFERICKIRNFGFEGYLNCTDVGINGKMSEFSALIGLGLLDQFPEYMEKRKSVYMHYQESLKNIPGIRLPVDNRDVEINCSYFYIIVDSELFLLTNLELNYALTAENIITRCYFYPPVHRTVYYRSIYKEELLNLPQTDWAAKHVLCLPMHTDIQPSEIEKIIEGIVRCRKYAEPIKKQLRGKIPSDWNSLIQTDVSEIRTDPYEQLIAQKQNG